MRDDFLDSSQRSARDFKAVVEHYKLKKPFIATWYVCREANIRHLLTIHPRSDAGRTLS